MTPQQFLEHIWADEGHYCIALPFTPKGSKTSTFMHKVFGTIEEAAAYVEKVKEDHNVFFCVHSLREERVWNPSKIDYKTGEAGAFEVRTQANMLQSKAFFFDLDVGESTARLPKYDTQRDAVHGLKEFCKATGLPKPLIVSSGGGLHVYWVIDEALPSELWRQHANKLQHIGTHFGLKLDPSRTTDTASVLRVAGTFNLKQDRKRPVEALAMPPVTPTGDFLSLLDEIIERNGVSLKPLAAPVKSSDDWSNITDDFPSTPVPFRVLISTCAQMELLVPLRGNVPEPIWFHSINLLRFVQNPKKFIHLMSSGYPGYSAEETEAKIAHLEAKNLGPTTCAKLAEVCGEDACKKCPHFGKVKSPIVAARLNDFAPPPVVELKVADTVVEVEVPKPPYPYERMSDGKICFRKKDKDGNIDAVMILDHDLYPVRRLVNEAVEQEQQAWCVQLPREAPKQFVLDADALYDRKKFVSSISNQGIYPKPKHIELLQDYMIAYIAQLQKDADADKQVSHLGWIDDHTKFVLPDRMLLDDGTYRSVSLAANAARAGDYIRKKGSLEKQIELLKFYNNPAYVASQFMILAGLAAPIFYATGHHGVIVNASGDSGASKSTSMYAAASLWGDPDGYTLNGTNKGATSRFRDERVTTLANLPICVDEITHLPPHEVADLAMNITQPGGRGRLDRRGIERRATGGYKSTIMLSTANSSLHGLLSHNNVAGNAGSMRVIEIVFRRLAVHSKGQADEFLFEIKQNYGWIGDSFMQFIVTHREAVERRIRQKMKEIDARLKINSSERFWSGTFAVVLVACEIACALKLLDFSVDQMLDWIEHKLLPAMRGVVTESYATPLSVLADYLESINENIMVVQKPYAGGNITNVTRSPRGQLLARYETEEGQMWLLKKGFKDYCAKIGANAFKIMEDLGQQGVIPAKNVRKVLGAGTDQAKAQTWCFIVNMRHPDVSGAVDLSVVEGGKAPVQLRTVT